MEKTIELNYYDLVRALDCSFRFINFEVLKKELLALDSDAFKEKEASFDRDQFFKMLAGEPCQGMEGVKANGFKFNNAKLARMFSRAVKCKIGFNVSVGSAVYFLNDDYFMLENANGSVSIGTIIFSNQPYNSFVNVMYYNQQKFLDLVLNPESFAVLHHTGNQISFKNFNIKYFQVIIPTCKTSKIIDPDKPIVSEINPKPNDYERDFCDVFNRVFTYHGLCNTREKLERPEMMNLEKYKFGNCQSGRQTCDYLKCCPLLQERITIDRKQFS